MEEVMESTSPATVKTFKDGKGQRVFHLRAVKDHAVLLRLFTVFSRRDFRIRALMIYPIKNSPYQEITLAAAGDPKQFESIRERIEGLAEFVEVDLK
jgi:acetolactate synthase small subunit